MPVDVLHPEKDKKREIKKTVITNSFIFFLLISSHLFYKLIPIPSVKSCPAAEQQGNKTKL